MPVLSNILGPRIRRSGSNPALIKKSSWASSPWSSPWSSPSITGAVVSDTTALSLTPFYRGLSLISGTIAGLPIHVHEDLADGTNRRVKTEETSYLWRRPNAEMTKHTFWERIAADEVRGNAFIFVVKDEAGGVELSGKQWGIWHIERQRVRVGRTSEGVKVYEIDRELPMIDYKDGGEIVHIPNLGDSLVGYDIVSMAAQALELGITAQEFAARAFNSPIPPGLITTDAAIPQARADELLGRWRASHSGVAKQDIAFLGNGAKFQQLSVDADKLQLQAVRSFQAEEVARLLGIPPHMLGITEKVTSWGSGIAELGQGFVTYTLNPHITRIKQAIDDALLVRELTDRYVEFDPGGLLRGNLTQQYGAHSIGIKGGFITPNEARRDLNLPPLPGGDDLVRPMQTVPASQGAAGE